MGKPYADELDAFALTYAWARKQDVGQLRHFLNRWAGDYATVVGSGGSFSAAAVVALMRELAHHSPTTPVTPLEFVSMLDRLSPRALLLSAEGKNRDILSAARAAQAADLATAAVTLTRSNPLVELGRESLALRTFSFEMDWVKDGYLATNSLLATVFLFYRALFGDRDFDHHVGALMQPARLWARRRELRDWPNLARAKRHGVLLLHSARAKAFAIDLESKLAEAALGSAQVTDLRQFAHGRHLQLGANKPLPYVIVATSAIERGLADATLETIPPEVPRQLVVLDGHEEQDLAIAGLIDAMFLVEGLAKGESYDPGQPDVPGFGRAVHALDPQKLLATRPVPTVLDLAARRKIAGRAQRKKPLTDSIRQAGVDYAHRLTAARIGGLVCDFDGTLCRAENRFGLMDPSHAEQVSLLIKQGLKFAIATGRGDSLHQALRRSIDASLHDQIHIGYYSGSLVIRLDEEFVAPPANPAFEPLWQWLKDAARVEPLAPLDQLARGGQFSVRLSGPEECAQLRAAIRIWLDEHDRRHWRVFCSGHSVDVLDADTSKRGVLEHLAKTYGLDPATQILRLGDCGQEDGNDHELLRDGLSLSCDRVSADLMACWNFGAAGSNQAEVTMAYLRGLVPNDGAFRLSASLFDLPATQGTA